MKQYIDQTLPQLREHLQKAAEVAGAVGVDHSTISSVLKKAGVSLDRAPKAAA